MNGAARWLRGFFRGSAARRLSGFSAQRLIGVRYGLAWLLGLSLLGGAGAVAAQDTGTHVLIISGLSGEDRFRQAFTEWGASLSEAALGKYGVPAANLVWLAEQKEGHARIRDRSTRANVERELRALAGRAGAQDRVLIVLIGHGSYQGGESRINLPGPDITAKELALLLEPLRTQRVAVVNTSSASGGFIQALSAPNRIVVTATKSGMEANETLFGGYFAKAFAGDAADSDRDKRVSLLEAFEYARLEVEREYKRANKLQTEHAVLDGVGDGKGVTDASTPGPHVQAARSFHLGSALATASGQPASPELRALHQEKERLEAALDALRARKSTMPEAEYEAALEKLLLELARNGEAIRRTSGGGS